MTNYDLPEGDNKLSYVQPAITVIELSADDVLTASGGGGGIVLPDDPIPTV